MHIAFPMRVDAIDKPGGDLVQVRQYLEAGAKIPQSDPRHFTGEILTDLNAGFSRFDLVHLTNIDRPIDTWVSFKRAKESRRPLVLSTIHHSYKEIERFERNARGGAAGMISGLLSFQMLELLRSLVRSRKYGSLRLPTLQAMLRGVRTAQAEILLGVDRVLVLTRREERSLAADIVSIPTDRIEHLPNGLDETSEESQREALRDIPVCVVGRIEARKNQLAILESLERLGVAGVFIGRESPNHAGYCEQFKRLIATSRSSFVGPKSHTETLGFLRRSNVHVSASWFEVASLVDIEAYLAGCKVVSSECGGTQELLGDDAEYVDPESAEGLDFSIKRALERSNGDARECPVLIAPSWQAVGERLGGLYHELTNRISTDR
jgi:glycosyltransferase involved in cell wall biosynthesis